MSCCESQNWRQHIILAIKYSILLRFSSKWSIFARSIDRHFELVATGFHWSGSVQSLSVFLSQKVELQPVRFGFFQFSPVRFQFISSSLNRTFKHYAHDHLHLFAWSHTCILTCFAIFTLHIYLYICMHCHMQCFFSKLFSCFCFSPTPQLVF